MKKIISLAVLFICFCAGLSAQSGGEVAVGVTVPYYHLTLDGDGISNDRSTPIAYDFDLQYRHVPYSGVCYLVDLAFGVFVNESDYIEKYIGNNTAMLDLSFMVGMGWNFFHPQSLNRLILGPVIGFGLNSFTSDPVYRNGDTEKITYEFSVGNFFAGLDLYFSHLVSQKVGVYAEVTGYAGIGQATYTKRTERKGSNNAWSKEETSDQKPTSYVWTIQPRAGVIIAL